VRFGLDLEDFHSAEQTGDGSSLAHALAERIESDVLPKAAFLTAGSPMIADAYSAKYNVRPAPIHNTFSINFAAASTRRGPLRLYWFSQTLGPGRGLGTSLQPLAGPESRGASSSGSTDTGVRGSSRTFSDASGALSEDRLSGSRVA
jgi:hypothetical protein